jgi:hypothetical protein
MKSVLCVDFILISVAFDGRGEYVIITISADGSNAIARCTHRHVHQLSMIKGEPLSSTSLSKSRMSFGRTMND